ncbi:MAG: phosphopantetheine-binding protein [bacterium]|nr:acyl carrier protein [Myxococcales bacterium]
MADALEQQIKEVIVESLMLEDITPDDIDTDAPLFVEGLGLDSIDALELAIALGKTFGIKTSAEDKRNREIFFSVASLARFIREERAAGRAPA